MNEKNNITTENIRDNDLTVKSVATEETSGFTAFEEVKKEPVQFPIDKDEYRELVRNELRLEILIRAAKSRKSYELCEYLEVVTGEKIKETDE